MPRADVTGWGADRAPERRPGVPRESSPRAAEGAHGTTPERMPERPGRLRTAYRDRLTPVYGTAQPPWGAAGRLRRVAYRAPEHKTRHWMLLLLADRVDALQSRLAPRGASGRNAGVAVAAFGAAFLLRGLRAWRA